MQLLIHITTTHQSFQPKSHELKERIYAMARRNAQHKDPEHPILRANLEQYLLDETPHTAEITKLLKTTMALTPELGHIIAIGRALIHGPQGPKTKIGVARTADGERGLLEEFWRDLSTLTKHNGTPVYVTWNGLEFTFPFLLERSMALNVTPSVALPRARFQPWKHLDLMAELSNYDRHRLLSLKDRLNLWDIKLNGRHLALSLKTPEELIKHWQNKDFTPLGENLKLTLHALHLLLKRAGPAIVNGTK